jgi:hypothetical protein
MDVAPKNQESESYVSRSPRLPWVLAAIVFVAVFAVGYSLDNDRSLSARDGVVSQTEAENGVIPSLPPQ